MAFLALLSLLLLLLLVVEDPINSVPKALKELVRPDFFY